MPKIYSDAADKARRIADGTLQHFSEATQVGISENDLQELKSLADSTVALSDQIDALRAKASELSHQAQVELTKLKDKIMMVKTPIKNRFEQPRWLDFGIEDKQPTRRK